MAEHAAELPVRGPVPGEDALVDRWQDDHGDPSGWSQKTVDEYVTEHNKLTGSATGVELDGCAHCSIPRRKHMQRWVSLAGWHAWVQPSNDQILARMKARRAARATNSPKGGAQ
jgi:hypothetical protein